MKTSEIFRQARSLLWVGDNAVPLGNGPGEHTQRPAAICFCIDKLDATRVERSKAKRLLLERLQPELTVTSWVRRRRLPGITYRRIQDHRRAWLDRLIAEFEAKGD